MINSFPTWSLESVKKLNGSQDQVSASRFIFAAIIRLQSFNNQLPVLYFTITTCFVYFRTPASICTT